MTGAAGAVGVAGQQPVAAHVVVVVAGGEGADDGQFVRMASGARQEFAVANAGDIRRDRLERPADVYRRVRLRIECFVLGGPTLKPQKDYVLGLAEGCAELARQPGCFGRERFPSRRAPQGRQGQPQRAHSADAKPLATTNTVCQGYGIVLD